MYLLQSHELATKRTVYNDNEADFWECMCLSVRVPDTPSLSLSLSSNNSFCRDESLVNFLKNQFYDQI